MLHGVQVPFVNKRAASLTAGKYVDNPYTASVEFWHFEDFAVPQIGWLSVGNASFDVGDQPVQIEVGADGLLLLHQDVASVKAIDFDQ